MLLTAKLFIKRPGDTGYDRFLNACVIAEKTGQYTTDAQIENIRNAADDYLSSSVSTTQHAKREAKLYPNVWRSEEYMVNLIGIAHQLSTESVRRQYENLCLAPSSRAIELGQVEKNRLYAVPIPMDAVKRRTAFVNMLVKARPEVFTPLEKNNWPIVGTRLWSFDSVLSDVAIRYRAFYALADMRTAEPGKDTYDRLMTAHGVEMKRLLTGLHVQCGYMLERANANETAQVTRTCRELQAMGGSLWSTPELDSFCAWQPDVRRCGAFQQTVGRLSPDTYAGRRMRAFLKCMTLLDRPTTSGEEFSDWQSCPPSESGYFRNQIDSFEVSIETHPYLASENRTTSDADDVAICFKSEGRPFGTFFRHVVDPLADTIVSAYAHLDRSDYRRQLLEQAFSNTGVINKALYENLVSHDNPDVAIILEKQVLIKAAIEQGNLEEARRLILTALPHYKNYPVASQRAAAKAALGDVTTAWCLAAIAAAHKNRETKSLLGAHWTLLAVEDTIGSLPHEAVRRLACWAPDLEHIDKLAQAIEDIRAIGDEALCQNSLILLSGAVMATGPWPEGRIGGADVLARVDIEIASALARGIDRTFAEALYGAETIDHIDRGFYFYRLLHGPSLQSVYTGWWDATVRGDQFEAYHCLQAILRIMLRHPDRPAHFVESIHGVTGMRLFLQQQMQREMPSRQRSYGETAARRLISTWQRAEVDTALKLLTGLRYLLGPSRAVAASWGMAHFYDWYPDEARLRELELISSQESLLALRAEHPAIDRLVRFLLAMQGPAMPYTWRDSDQQEDVQVALGAAGGDIYSSQAEHIAATLPHNEHTVEVVLSGACEVIVHGNYGATVGPALCSYSEQMALGLLKLAGRWPDELGPTLLQMNSGACIDGQLVALQDVLQDLQDEGAAVIELPVSLSKETFFERCVTAFRTQAIAQYRRAHNLSREQAADTFEDRDDFIATFYSAELFRTWLAEQGHTQRWTHEEVDEGIAYLMDLCLIGAAA